MRPVTRGGRERGRASGVLTRLLWMGRSMHEGRGRPVPAHGVDGPATPGHRVYGTGQASHGSLGHVDPVEITARGAAGFRAAVSVQRAATVVQRAYGLKPLERESVKAGPGTSGAEGAAMDNG
jgi:hypothetical protein